MNIGIDCYGCEHGRSGTGLYLLSLTKSFLQEQNHKIDLFGLEIDRYSFDTSSTTCSYTGLQIPDVALAEKMWHVFCLNRFVKKQKYDVVLYPAALAMLPITSSVPSVLVINELFSDILKRTKNVFARMRLTKCLKKATKIICVSQFIKKELIAFGIDGEKIVVVYNGVDQNLFYERAKTTSDLVTIKPFSIKKPFIIFPSRIVYPEKKHVELIKAFTLFKKRTGHSCRLVLAGSECDGTEFVQKAVLESPYASDIVLTGHFPHNNLPELLSCAEACIVPSTNEGFGLPLLEAMACGVPVLSSSSGALSEIGGPATLYENQDDTEAFSYAIERILKDENLRERMIKENKDWVSRFTWKRAASMTISVLESAVQCK